MSNLVKKESSLSVEQWERFSYEEVRCLYVLALPLMWVLVRWVKFKRRYGLINEVNTILYDGLGKSCRAIKEGAASWKALEVIYNYKFGKKLSTIVDDFWIGMRNAQAVRNRLKILKHELWATANEIAKHNKEVRILSLAAGSAEGVFQVASRLKQSGYPFSIVLIDVDKDAIEFVLKEAQRLGLSENVHAEVGNVLSFQKQIGNFRPNVIEMAGLLDYLNDGIAKMLIRQIQKILPEGGYFLTCHIHKNAEREFLTEVIGWGKDPVMLYRTRQELEDVVREGNFNTMTIITEPHSIHSVVIAQKAT